MPSTKTQSSVMPDDVQDGWQCNSPLPIGKIVDRRNDLVMWRIGSLPQSTQDAAPVFILAVGKPTDSCRFYFVDVFEDTKFVEPILHPLELSVYAPFSSFLTKMVEDSLNNCTEDASSNSLSECKRLTEQRVIGSASQIVSKRPIGSTITAKSYLFINGEAVDEEGNKI
jgi:hypothetical protein